MLELDELLPIVLEDDLGVLVKLVHEHAFVRRAFDYELVLVGPRHDVLREIRGGF